jgi:hypothetical protein
MARRMVMEESCRRLLRIGRSHGVIASTDGDTRVCPRWVASILDEIAAGADAIGGRIWSCAREVAALEPGVRLRYRRDSTYRALRAAYESMLDPEPSNPWPRHYQYFGASMAVTVNAYRAAGGLPAVPVLEDMAFARALERIDARLRHSPRVRVQTSLRCHGKVDLGLSTTLSQWKIAARADEDFLVESADAIARRARDRRRVRLLWEAREWSERPAFRTCLPRAAELLEVDEAWLLASIHERGTFGALWHGLLDRQQELKTGPFFYPHAGIERAISDLRARVAPGRFTLRSQRVRTGRAGTFLHGLPSHAATSHPGRWRFEESNHAPVRPSAGNPEPLASNGRAAGVRLPPAF